MSLELEKYYLKIIDIVSNLREEQKFDEAIELIGEELQAVYIPLEFEAKLTQLLTEVSFDKNALNANNKFLEMDKNELLKRITKFEASAIYAVMILFEKFKDEIIQKDLDSLGTVLTSKIAHNDLKIVVLEQMKKHNFLGEYDFFSLPYKKFYKIDLVKQKFINEDPIFKKAFQKLDELYLEEPMTSELANNLVFSTYNHLFPDFEKIGTGDNLVYSVAEAIEVIMIGKSKDEILELTNIILKITEVQKGSF